jgi:hypothetical protein
MMLGKIIGPILISLDAHGHGIAIVGGVSLRVEGGGKEETRWVGAEGHRITLELNVTDVLDEKQQQEKINRLEIQLASEREKLDGMRAIFNDEAYAARHDE